jgi:hypothetical protein
VAGGPLLPALPLGCNNGGVGAAFHRVDKVEETAMSLFSRSALLAGFGLLLAATPALAQNDPSFRLTNNGNVPINEIYVSSSANQNWGADRLGDRTLAVGGTYTIRLPAGQCVNDIRVVWSNGQSRERRQVNTCNLTDVVFP